MDILVFYNYQVGFDVLASHADYISKLKKHGKV